MFVVNRKLRVKYEMLCVYESVTFILLPLVVVIYVAIMCVISQQLLHKRI